MLDLPNYDLLVKNLSQQDLDTAERFWSALWAVYIRNKGNTSLIYWMEQFDHPRSFNALLMISKEYIHTDVIPERNWAQVRLNEDKLLTLFSEEELVDFRKQQKFDEYLPIYKDSVARRLVRVNGKVEKTGLIRKGFQKAAQTQYFYNTVKMKEYKEHIVRNTNKGMTKMRKQYNISVDNASYDNVCEAIIEHMINHQEMYSQGNSFSDSRGRAIKESLGKVANPIGFKDFRSLLTIPENIKFTMDDQAIKNVYLFIAELVGYKRGTVEGKIEFGKQCAYEQTLPELTDDSTHEVIWLERLYNELTALNIHKSINGTYKGFHWSVPIELDASASMLSYMGVLLGDKRLLEMVNATGDTDVLNDPWYIEGLSRNQVKKAATPMLYGSGKTPAELWKDNKISYDFKDVQVINDQLKNGALGAANAFKDFLINYCNPKSEMVVKIGKDVFEIKCNHYTRVGEVSVAYDLYDTDSGTIRRVVHTKTKKVPDLDRYKRYFATLLIHNLDSQVANTIAGKVYDKYGYCLDIHDAFIVSPVAAEDVRQWYAEEITKLFNNRQEILRNFFISIGVNSSAMVAWYELLDKVDPIEDFVCRKEVLK